MNIGRNDLCHCGSGKKYKKCCMKKVTLLDAIRDDELRRMQAELFSFVSFHMDQDLEDAIEDYIEDVSEEDEELLTALLFIWGIFTYKENGERTLIEAFIEQKRKESVRPAVLSQLEKWIDCAPSMSVIKEVEQGGWYTVEDVFSKDVKKVKMDEDENDRFEEGSLLFGYLVPFGQYYAYFIISLDLPFEEGVIFAEGSKKLFAESEFQNVNEFLIHEYPAIVKTIVEDELDEELDVSELEWENPLYQLSASLLEKKLIECGVPGKVQGIGIMLWNIYCNRVKPKMKKPQIYAAAMHYFIEKKLKGYHTPSQNKVAEMYHISTSSLSKAYRQLELNLGEDVAALFNEAFAQFEEELGLDRVLDLFEEELDLDDEPVSDRGMPKS